MRRVSLARPCLEAAGLQAGHEILIYGASGSVGTAGVQLARQIGGRVTAVCSTPNVELVASLDPDEVIDYTQQDFTTGGAVTTSSSMRSGSTPSADRGQP